MDFQYQTTQNGGEFYLAKDEKRIAEITYVTRDDSTIIANHTWVDDSLRGQGVAGQLLDTLVTFAREHHFKIVPACTYVDAMFRRDKSFADVVA